MKCSCSQQTHLFCICSSLNKKYIMKMVDSVFLTTSKLPHDAYKIFFVIQSSDVRKWVILFVC